MRCFVRGLPEGLPRPPRRAHEFFYISPKRHISVPVQMPFFSPAAPKGRVFCSRRWRPCAFRAEALQAAPAPKGWRIGPAPVVPRPKAVVTEANTLAAASRPEGPSARSRPKALPVLPVIGHMAVSAGVDPYRRASPKGRRSHRSTSGLRMHPARRRSPAEADHPRLAGVHEITSPKGCVFTYNDIRSQ